MEKLERLRLVGKDLYGEYALVRNVDVKVLQAFSQVYSLVFGRESNVFAIAFGLFASVFAWCETVRTLRKRPFLKKKS